MRRALSKRAPYDLKKLLEYIMCSSRFRNTQLELRYEFSPVMWEVPRCSLNDICLPQLQGPFRYFELTHIHPVLDQIVRTYTIALRQLCICTAVEASPANHLSRRLLLLTPVPPQSPCLVAGWSRSYSFRCGPGRQLHSARMQQIIAPAVPSLRNIYR